MQASFSSVSRNDTFAVGQWILSCFRIPQDCYRKLSKNTSLSKLNSLLCSRQFSSELCLSLYAMVRSLFKFIAAVILRATLF